MRHIIWGLLINGILSVYFNPVLPQPSQTVQVDDLLHQLAEAYNNFDYQKSAELLTIAFKSIDRYPPRKKIEIYRYAAFIAFQKGNTTLAADHFWKILEIDPTYSLDPVDTPPKLMTLFQKTKIDYLKDLNQRLKILERQNTKAEIPWRSFVLPGWEQWHRGYRVRGAILSAASMGTLGGLIYSAIKANREKQRYLNARDAQTAADLYKKYNSHYQRQFYFGYAFVTLWAVSQIDLMVWSQPRVHLQASLNYLHGYLSLPSLTCRVSF